MQLSFWVRPAGFAVAALVCLLSLPLTAFAGVVYVSTVPELQSAILNASPNDEIVVAAGTYTTTAYLNVTDDGVTVRGATGNPADVIIQGMGMNVDTSAKEGFALYADDVTIQDLTVQEYFFHAIHFQPGADRMHIVNVITRNNGQQHIKGAKYNTGGLIENTLCEQTYVRTNLLPSDPRGVDYVGGIDLHGGVNFVIRDTIVRNIMGAGGDADGAIFAWNQSANLTVERCIVIGCNRGICFGNNSGGSAGYDVDGGIARNNFVYARTAANPPADQPWLGNADCAIDVFACRNGNLYNNTVWTDSGSYGRTVRVGKGVNYSNSNVQFKYNIIRGNFQVFTGSNYTSVGDITGNVAQANWFVDPANADFHLTPQATLAIDHAVTLADVPEDYDRNVRPFGALPDVGADEFKLGDIDHDGAVTVFDVIDVVVAFGATPGSPNWNPAADLNKSGTVDVMDVIDVVTSFGT